MKVIGSINHGYISVGTIGYWSWWYLKSLWIHVWLSFGEHCISFADISKLPTTLPNIVFPKAHVDVVIMLVVGPGTLEVAVGVAEASWYHIYR